MSDAIIRTPGLRGRLPQKPYGQRFGLRWVDEYAAEDPALTNPTYPVDVSGGLTAWGMLGNGPDPTLTGGRQPVGDCTFAGRQHLRMAKAAREAETETWQTSNALVDEYLAYDHGQDEGANIADLLLSWYRSGKILAFAPVDCSDRKKVDGAMQRFGGVYCGVSLTDNADQLFSEGKVWSAGTPDPSEGHCIVKVKANKTRDTFVTWGALQQATTGWTKNCLEEAWVIITHEDAVAANLDLAQLHADIATLGGKSAPIAVPELVPVPVAVKVPWWKPALVTAFTVIAALPVLIPTIAYAFNISAAESARINVVIGGIVTAAAALHRLLVQAKVIASGVLAYGKARRRARKVIRKATGKSNRSLWAGTAAIVGGLLVVLIVAAFVVSQ